MQEREENTRTERAAIVVNPQALGSLPQRRGMWYETPEEIEAGLAWGEHKAELLRWVRRQMRRRLTLRERRILELCAFRGMTVRDAAKTVGSSPTAAHMALKRALRRLRLAAGRRGIAKNRPVSTHEPGKSG